MGKRLLLSLMLLCSMPLLANPIEMTLTSLNGQTLKISDYRGKWVVLNYWATWCPPCLAEIPELVLFHENHKDDKAVVIGIDMEVLEPGLLKQFVEDNLMTYPVVPMVADMPMFDTVSSYPTTYLIDPDGKAVVKHVGAVTAEAIEQFIDSYVPDKMAER